MALFAERIREEYYVNWIIDNIPATTPHYTVDQSIIYELGYPLGFVGNRNMDSTYAKAGVAYINNHVVIKLSVNEKPEGYRIVGFEVSPYSVKHQKYADGDLEHLKTCDNRNQLYKNSRAQAASGTEILLDKSVIWTYDVTWAKSDVEWASRWDAYLKLTNSEIHWFSIVNSLVIVVFMSTFVAMIMIRTLRKDLQQYDTQDLDEEAQMEETGWKLIHADVFRPPKHSAVLSVFVGTGVQIFGMIVVTLIFALLGFLSPANRGSLMTALLVLFAFMGIFAGYWSTRLYTMFKLANWKTNTLCTALFYPATAFMVFFILNLMIWGEKSSGAVPFTTLLALLVLWFGVSVPLVYLGAHLAIRKDPIVPPIKVNPLPREIKPNSVDYLTNSHFSILIGGILPFAMSFIEIFFILSSIWMHQFYYMFGFLFAVFVILIITCAEISIVMVYFQLCRENYHWWWRSFFCSGCSALYMFLYSGFYFSTKLQITGVVPAIFYFSYMWLGCLAFFLLTGTAGFVASYVFVYVIYSSVKLD